MTSEYSGFRERYEVVEAPDFLVKVQALMGSVERWDEMRTTLDWWLHERPKELPLCRHVQDDLWFAKIATSPLVYLIYEVNDLLKRVVYLDIRVVPPPLEELDPELRISS